MKTTRRSVPEGKVECHFSWKKPLVLVCDASPHGAADILSYIMEDCEEMPVAYGSRTLGTSERNYAQIDQEGLTGLQKFHQFLVGRYFFIVTDHKPLLGHFKPNSVTPMMISPQMLQWKLML